MRIRFKIFGFARLRQAIGEDEINIEFDGSMVKDLVWHLTEVYGDEVAKAILQKDGHLKHGVRLLRNGHQWIDRDDLETNIMDGDVLVLSLLVAGG